MTPCLEFLRDNSTFVAVLFFNNTRVGEDSKENITYNIYTKLKAKICTL